MVNILNLMKIATFTGNYELLPVIIQITNVH
jgi:hypothetical protein